LAEVQPEPISVVVSSDMASTLEEDNLDVPAFLRKRGEIM
jgi:hypothetical protein